MARNERVEALKKLESERGGRLVISYITSTRTNFEIQIGDDVLPLFHEHLEAATTKAKKGVDLFIHSNGGSGTVPWRLVSLIREYTKDFAVLVPHRAFSAATLIALGANDIVMHRMGCLGPIDPSVANQFNPPNPQNPGLPIPISVEDVTAYFKLVKEEIGINHEDELIQALIALTDAKMHPLHPLALGNVQRSHQQSRLMARKLLLTHMEVKQEHEIDAIIDILKSNLFFHGHPINRKEAKEESLNLKVTAAPVDLERAMWKLYTEYEKELRLREPFSPLHELDIALQAQLAAQAQQAAAQAQQAASQGQQAGAQGQPGTNPPAIAIGPAIALNPTQVKANLKNLPGVYVESIDHTDVFLTDLNLQRTSVNTPMGPQELIKQEIIWQRWEKEI